MAHFHRGVRLSSLAFALSPRALRLLALLAHVCEREELTLNRLHLFYFFNLHFHAQTTSVVNENDAPPAIAQLGTKRTASTGLQTRSALGDVNTNVQVTERARAREGERGREGEGTRAREGGRGSDWAREGERGRESETTRTSTEGWAGETPRF